MNVRKIIIHCSDSDVAAHDDIGVIEDWHIARGFSQVGYHFVIRKNGEIQRGRVIGMPGAHCRGHNEDSIGICLTGKQEFSEKQFSSLVSLVQDLCKSFFLSPRGDVYPHSHFNSDKTCPNFDIEKLDFY